MGREGDHHDPRRRVCGGDVQAGGPEETRPEGESFKCLIRGADEHVSMTSPASARGRASVDCSRSRRCGGRATANTREDRALRDTILREEGRASAVRSWCHGNRGSAEPGIRGGTGVSSHD